MRKSLAKSHPAAPASAPLVDVAAPEVVTTPHRVTNGAQSRRLGSKANEATWKTIINQMPPHDTYIEPFLGWGAIMLHKAPANHSICLDREEEKVKNFLLELTTAHPTMTAGIVSADDAAWARFGKTNKACTGNSAAPEELAKVAINGNRAAQISSSPNHTAALLVGNALSFLASYPWRGDELVYCDPPYLLETRTSRHRYLFEMDTLEHQALLDILLEVPAYVMVSGYHSKLYAKMLKKWRLVTFEAVTRGGTMRTEHLWCNFREPVELHDYRYVGDNYRRRQDHNRMRKRWLNKLTKLSVLNRRALFAAFEEYQQIATPPVDDRTCPCGCGLRLTGKKRAATPACRKRLQRFRKCDKQA